MSQNQEISKKEQYNLNKLQKRLRRNVGEAIADFNMIEEGDRIMVCLSGGKDSYTMLEILRNLQQSAPINFSLVAVNLDQKQPGFPEHVLPEYLEKLGVEYKIVEENTYGIVKEKIPEGKNHLLTVFSPSSRYPLSYRNGTGGDEDRVGSPS
ncbi:C32 tRNA thiolase [Escherichia coli]|uniref:C32 tRNA thiolase n=1 Tax=Escherichia coli TaxID=562 RepID=A0A377D3J9_ECOLX|nr:C32 tRNA thiolase [Escherichia coli]